MKEEIINKMVKKLEEPINNLNVINIEKLKQIKNNINLIVKYNIKDEKIIESIFDILLDLTYFYDDELNEVYFNFLDYYKNIDKESTEDYKKYYLYILNNKISDKIGGITTYGKLRKEKEYVKRFNN